MSSRRYEDDDLADNPPDRRAQERSGWVTVLAVITLIFGGLVSVIALIVNLITVIVMVLDRGADMQEYFIIFAVFFPSLIVGLGYVVTAFGLLNRRRWARIMALVLGAFGFVVAAGTLLAATLVVLDRSRPFFQRDLVGEGILLCFGLFFNLAYGIFVYILLLRSQVASEFR